MLPCAGNLTVTKSPCTGHLMEGALCEQSTTLHKAQAQCRCAYMITTGLGEGDNHDDREVTDNHDDRV